MARLSVNIDHVATLREARGGNWPDPVHAAVLAELAGADGITLHIREDRRHAKERDLYILKNVTQSHLTLEMAAAPDRMKLALEVKPDMVTLVPETRDERTTEGGLDLEGARDFYREQIEKLQLEGIVVSLFIDPVLDAVKAAAKLRTDFIEINTRAYSEAASETEEIAEAAKIKNAAELATGLHLGVNAGHGLNYKNVQRLVQIPEIEEYSIGHSIVARSVFVGFHEAVVEMLSLVAG